MSSSVAAAYASSKSLIMIVSSCVRPADSGLELIACKACACRPSSFPYWIVRSQLKFQCNLLFSEFKWVGGALFMRGKFLSAHKKRTATPLKFTKQKINVEHLFLYF